MNDFLEIIGLESIYTTGGFNTYAVNDISFKLKRKQTLGLVGETGAGKTTTALSILRLLPERTGKIVSGKIMFEGKNLLEISEMDMTKVRGAKISMIFQDPMTSLNPSHTVGDQIFEALELHNDEKKSAADMHKRVDEMLELVGIPHERKKCYPFEFSGGMKQRIVIAIALACNPDLLIADEPTSALDVTIQAQVLAMMEELKQKMNMSMIMITHDLGIIAKTCDYVGIVYAGEIIEYGSFEDLFIKKDHHPYTKGLFDAIPNIKAHTERLTPIEGLMPDPTNLPSGCKFHPRCPKCMEICKSVKPKDFVENDHRIKCHLFNTNGQEV